MSTSTAVLLAVCSCCSATRSSSPRSSPSSRPAVPRSSRAPRRAPRFARTTLRAMENMSLVIGVNQLGITVCSLVLGAVAEPTAAHLLEPLLHAAARPRVVRAPDRHRGRAGGRGLPPRRAGRDDPEEHRPGRTRPGRAGAGHPDLGHRLGHPPGDHGRQRPRLGGPAAVRRAPHGRGELDVHPRGGGRSRRGVPRRGPARGRRVRPALRRPRLHREDRRDGADARPRPCRPYAAARPVRTSRRCAPPPASAASRWSATTGELLGYLHIKDVLETDEVRRQRLVEDKWIRPFALVRDDDLLHDTLEKLQRRGAHMARVVDAAGATARRRHPGGRDRGAGRRDPRQRPSRSPRHRRSGAAGRVGRTVRVSPADRRRRTVPSRGRCRRQWRTRQTRDARVWTVPNALSFLRLLGVPLFLWLVLGPEADGWALGVLLLSGRHRLPRRLPRPPAQPDLAARRRSSTRWPTGSTSSRS